MVTSVTRSVLPVMLRELWAHSRFVEGKMRPRKGKDQSHIHTCSKGRILLGKPRGPLHSAEVLPPCGLTVRLAFLARAGMLV